MEGKNEYTDEEILSLLQDGNMRYFSMLTERYENYILKKCKSYVKDEDIAEDLCQEVLIKVYMHIHEFQKKAKFSTWLYAIIHNTCIDYLRKNKKNMRQVITEKMVDEIADLIDDTDNVPEELSVQILDKLLEEMSPEEKLILLLKYKEKHAIKDIQLSLNLSESAVKMRLKRAKEKINTLYNRLSKT